MRRGVRSLVLAVLVVGASVAGAIGTVSGQSAGTYEHTFTSGDGQYVVDVGDYSGQINIQFTTPEVPDGSNVVYATTLSGAQLSNGRIRLVNQGAYSNLTVTVSGPSTEPTYDSGGIEVASSAYTLGSTGGDVDMSCGTLEQARSAAWTNVIDCTGYPGIDSINTSSSDADQTELDIYQSGLDNRASTENSLTILENYLSDTETTARIEGQNAYIRALNNGSSEATARSEATEAIQDYYATKQQNLLNQWESDVANVEYLRGVADNESGIEQTGWKQGLGDSYVGPEYYNGTTDAYGVLETAYMGTSTETITLVNGNTTDVTAYSVGLQNYDGGTYQELRENGTYHPDNSPQLSRGWGGTTLYVTGNITIDKPDSSYSEIAVISPSEYNQLWTGIEQQSQSVQNEIDTIVNNTYAGYQSGEINNSDLVDPYTLSRRDAGDDYQSWAAAQLTTMGVNSPEALDQTGAFEVSTESGSEYRGILFLTENPAGGVESGSTYDAASLSGTEYVVTANRTVELTGNFTVGNITNTDGEQVQNVTYQDVTYQSSNATELIEQYDTLLETREEIEARESALVANSGVDGYLGGETDRTLLIGMAAALGGSILLLRG